MNSRCKPQGASYTRRKIPQDTEQIELELRAIETKLDPNGNTHNTIKLTNNVTLVHEHTTTTCNRGNVILHRLSVSRSRKKRTTSGSYKQPFEIEEYILAVVIKIVHIILFLVIRTNRLNLFIQPELRFQRF